MLFKNIEDFSCTIMTEERTLCTILDLFWNFLLQNECSAKTLSYNMVYLDLINFLFFKAEILSTGSFPIYLYHDVITEKRINYAQNKARSKVCLSFTYNVIWAVRLELGYLELSVTFLHKNQLPQRIFSYLAFKKCCQVLGIFIGK